MFNIAIIDDNQIVLQSIQNAFQWESMDCTICGTAENGIDGLELLQKKRPDIVIIDIMMPGFTGLDVIAQLKETLPDTCFIVITGYNTIDSARKSIRPGIFDYIVKPIANDDLLSVLKDAIASIQTKRSKAALPDGTAHESETGIEKSISEIRMHISEYAPLIREAITYIDANVFQEISLTKVAASLGISTAYLSNLFKRETGKSFLDYVTMVKLCQAKILLKNPRNKVYEVGQMLGYPDYSYFYQVFKKHMGYAPSSSKP